MLYVHQPVIRFVVRVRTAFVFVNKYTRIFLRVLKTLLTYFRFAFAHATMAEQRSGGVAFSLPLHACRLIRAACMYQGGLYVCTLCCMQTQICVWGLDNFRVFDDCKS
jgi:hypothetical protein